MNSSATLLSRIIKDDCCIGCGLCAHVAPDTFAMAIDSLGRYQPRLLDSAPSDSSTTHSALRVCPFSNEEAQETELARSLYGQSCVHHSEIGYYRNTYVGHVIDRTLREGASSGGIITWLCSTMLGQDLVDGVIHVTPELHGSSANVLFQYSISRSVEEIQRGSKSKYYPIELSGVLRKIKETPGRYVLVGLPCFIKAIRRLAHIDPIIRERIPHMIGLVCGHLKSHFFADLLAAQMDLMPGEIRSFDFRVKLPGRSAGAYGVRARSLTQDHSVPSSDLFGTDWGLHLFRYGACDSCDDVFAETADAAIGDAWLPEYLPDWMGNSVVVARHPLIIRLLEEGVVSGELHLDSIQPETAALSQAGGLRDRREDILWRQELKRRQGLWVPQKRDFGKQLPSIRRRWIINTRVALRKASLHLWSQPEIKGHPDKFIKALNPLLRRYRFHVIGPIRIIVRSARGILANLRKRVLRNSK